MLISSNDGMWSVDQYISPDFQVYGDEVVVYQKGSGATYLINCFGAEILKLLLTHPRSLKDLVDVLNDLSQDVEQKDISNHVQKYLKHCQLLGIVNYQSNES